MAVQIESRADVLVAKPFLNDLRMHVAFEQLRRMSVSQVMKPDARKFGSGDEADELVGKAVRDQRLTVGLGDDVHVVGLAHAEPKQLLSLPDLVPAQLLHGEG